VLSYQKHFRATSTPEVRESTYKTAGRLLTCLKQGQGQEAAAEMLNHLNLVSAQLKEITLNIAPVLTGLDKNPQGFIPGIPCIGDKQHGESGSP
jgi:hypothetical protein